ncbi:MAG: hypothetical protein KDD76_07005, partial [Rickettsiales bacterium]|nr:hypothetical protein [Rickettsiales bacterium]
MRTRFYILFLTALLGVYTVSTPVLAEGRSGRAEAVKEGPGYMERVKERRRRLTNISEEERAERKKRWEEKVSQ